MPDRDGSRDDRLRATGLSLAGLATLVAVSAVHVGQGAADLTLLDVWQVMVGTAGPLETGLILDLRLPRLAAGVLAGASLAVAGAILQTTTRNRMASPATLAVNSGAYLAIVVVALLWPAAPLPPFAAAFLGGIVAAGLVFGTGIGAGGSPARIVLAGVAVALALTSITSAVLILNDTSTTGLHLWGAGSLVQAGWDRVGSALWPALVFGAAAVAMGGMLDVYELGDTAARSLGQPVRRVRLAAMGVAVLLAAAATAVVGPVAFVGLLVPNLVREAGVRSHRPKLVTSAVWGAVILLAADVAARAVHGPVREMPAGVVTAILGAPVLAYLALRRTRDRGDPRAAVMVGPGAGARPPYRVVVAAIPILVVAAVVGGLTVGVVPVSPIEVGQVLLGAGSRATRFLVLELRASRVAVAAAAGVGLAASGLILQDVLRNPLAAPATLGVAPAAGLAGLGAILLVPGIGTLWIAVAAVAGALASLGVVVAATWSGGLAPERVVLVGISVAAIAAAASKLLVVTADVRVARALVWLAGSTYGADMPAAKLLLLATAILAVAAVPLLRRLDVIGLGDDAAGGLGVDVLRTRAGALILAAGLAGLPVAVVGPIAFVGILAPHAARLLAGPSASRRAPVAIGLGAVLVIVADTVGRGLLAPVQLPVGLVTSLVGAPYFGFLLLRARGGGPG